MAAALAALCLMLVAAPAAEAKVKRCPGASVQGPPGLNLELADFRVTNTSCSTAVDIMSRYAHQQFKGKVGGWTITQARKFTGRKGHALFTCVIRPAKPSAS